MIAIDKNEKSWKIVLLSLLVLLTREESIFFTGIAVSHLFWMRRYLVALAISLITILFLAIGYLYFFYATYFSFSFGIKNFVFFVIPILLFFFCIAIRTACNSNWFAVAKSSLHDKIIKIIRGIFVEIEKVQFFIWINLYLIPLWANWITESRNPYELFSPRYFVLVGVLVVLFSRYLSLKSKINQSIFYVFCGVIFLFSLWQIRTIISPEKLPTNVIVWSLSKEINNNSLILTSLAYQQAFWYHNAVVVERLPALSTKDDERFWPKNQQRLMRYINEAEYFFLDKKGVSMIENNIPDRLKCNRLATLLFCQK